MGWLTGYSYRMDVPVANPNTAENKQLVVPFPAWFLYSQGKITSASYNDVHVTKADGTTELPCSLNAAKNQLTIDYASMAVGHTTLYVYYGKSGASAPTAASYTVAPTDTAILTDPFTDTNGVNLSAHTAVTTWTKHPVHNTDYLQVQSNKLVSTNSGASTYYAATTTTSADYSVSADWTFRTANSHTLYLSARLDTTQNNQYRAYYLAGVWYLQALWNNAANSAALGNYSMTPSAGQTVNVKITCTGTTIKLFLDGVERVSATDSNITAKGKGGFQTNGATSSSSTGWEMDNFVISELVAATASATVQAVAANGEVTSEGDTSPTDYIWGEDLDATYLNSGSTGTYYGGAATTAHKVGIDSGGSKYHYLIKPGEWMLRKGVTASAQVHLYCESAPAASVTLNAHRLRNTGSDSSDANTRHEQWVRTGWTNNDFRSYPTWTNRYYSDVQGTTVAWQTAGAIHANEIDSSEHVDLTVGTGISAGYQSLSLTAGWVDTWMTDSYSQGVLIKDSTDSAGGSNRTLTITAQGQTNSPVIQIDYTSVEVNQFSKRKLTTDTYQAPTFAVQNRYCLTPSLNSMAVMAVVNAELRMDFFYISPGGRMRRMVKNSNVGGSARFSTTSPGWGMHYDTSDGRFWVGGVDSASQTFALGYSSPYVLDSVTWDLSPITSAYKGSFIVRSGVAHVIYPVYGFTSRAGDTLAYRTYTRSTDTWGSATTIATCATPGDTTLATTIGAADVMTVASPGTITLTSGTNYPSFGTVMIGSECFFYSGKSSNTLTGVHRMQAGTAGALHSAGATVYQDNCQPGYVAASHDTVNDVMRITFAPTSMAGMGAGTYTSEGGPFSGTFMYVKVASMNYDFTQSRWENAAGTDQTANLPLKANQWEVVSSGVRPAYNNNLLAGNATALAAYWEYASDCTTIGATKVAKLASGAWSTVDTGTTLGEASLSKDATGHQLSGITVMDSAGTSSYQQISSPDGGATWGSPVTLATHDFAQPADNTNWRYSIWCSDTTEQGLLSGVGGIAYYTHFAQHGAITLNQVIFAVDIATGLATETDTGLSATPTATTSIATGLAEETDTALPIVPDAPGVSQTGAVGQAQETDSAWSVSGTAPQTVAAGLASEADAALAIQSTPGSPSDLTLPLTATFISAQSQTATFVSARSQTADFIPAPA